MKYTLIASLPSTKATTNQSPLCLLLFIAVIFLPNLNAEEAWFKHSINDENTVTITGYSGPIDGELVVPGELGGIPVTVIDRSAFSNTNFHTVRISDNIKWISTTSFRNNTSLRNVYLPASLEHIMRRSFVFEAQFYVPEESEHFRSVDGVLFSKDMTTIIRYPSIREGEYSIPDSVTHIRGDTFRNSRLNKINIPDQVTIIGRLAFNSIQNLTAIELPPRLEHFGEKGKQFENCENLQSIVIPDGVTIIPREIFRGCTSLSSVTLPRKLETIGYKAFQDCTSLTNIVIPDGVSVLSRDIFRGCTNLTSITFPRNLQQIDDGAFRDCTSLTEIVIPATVTQLGGRTGGNVFNGCTNLRKVYFLGDAPEVMGNIIFPVRPPSTPAGEWIIIYHTAGASGWPEFGEKMEWQGLPTREFHPADLEQ